MRLSVPEVARKEKRSEARVRFKIRRGDYPSARLCSECRTHLTIDSRDLMLPANRNRKPGRPPKN